MGKRTVLIYISAADSNVAEHTVCTANECRGASRYNRYAGTDDPPNRKLYGMCTQMPGGMKPAPLRFRFFRLFSVLKNRKDFVSVNNNKFIDGCVNIRQVWNY